MNMKLKIPKPIYDPKSKTWVVIPAPGKGKAIKLCEDGIHYEIVDAKEGHSSLKILALSDDRKKVITK